MYVIKAEKKENLGFLCSFILLLFFNLFSISQFLYLQQGYSTTRLNIKDLEGGKRLFLLPIANILDTLPMTPELKELPRTVQIIHKDCDPQHLVKTSHCFQICSLQIFVLFQTLISCGVPIDFLKTNKQKKDLQTLLVFSFKTLLMWISLKLF